jgi:AraC family transcriptional regulator
MGQVPRIEELAEKKLVGMSKEMSRSNDKTADLWRAFMPRRKEVTGRVSDEYMSMQVYPDGPQQIADPMANFTKWAVVEVHQHDDLPESMAPYTLGGGSYAVFVHNGPATDLSTIVYIFQEWLPGSEYTLDDREHFELLAEGYDAFDANAREEIWIPVVAKNASKPI